MKMNLVTLKYEYGIHTRGHLLMHLVRYIYMYIEDMGVVSVIAGVNGVTNVGTIQATLKLESRDTMAARHSPV